MPGICWHKILRDIWGNRLRTSLVILSMAVGVMGVGMLASARINLSRTLNEAYQAIRPAHAELSLEPFDDSLLQAVRRVPGVAEAEGRTGAGARLIGANGREYFLSLTVIPDFGVMRMNEVQWLSGDSPPPLREMWLERRSAAYVGARLGDTVLVETPQGKRRLMRIAGIGHDLTMGAADLTGIVSGFITPATLEWLGLPSAYTQLNLRMSGDPRDMATIQAVLDRVVGKIERSGRVVYIASVRDPDAHPADALLANVMLIMAAVSLLALVLSGFLVVNVVLAVLAQEVRQIGMMKAIGALDEQIVAIYLGMVFVFTVSALIIAIPCGIVGGNLFVMLMAPMFNTDPQLFGPSLPVVGLQLAAGLAVPLLAALYPVLSGTRVTVYQALNNFGIGGGVHVSAIVDRLSDLPCARHLPRPWLLALRNTFRRRVRLALTLVTLTIASTAFVGVVGARASLARSFDMAQQYWAYDVGLSFSHSYPQQQIQSAALQVPGVVAAESWGTTFVRRRHADGSKSRELGLVTPPAGTALIKPILLEGRWLLPEDDNAVVINTDVLKEEPDLKVGDTLELRIGKKITLWRVVGVVLGVMSGPMLYANDVYFDQVTGQGGRRSAVEVATLQHSAAYQAATAMALEEHFERAGMRVAGTVIVADTRTRVNQVLNVFALMLSMVTVLLALVGALGLAGTMSLNVLERTREIGIVRAIGATDGTVRQLILVESIVIGLLSWALGTVLALPLGMLLTDLAGRYLLRTRLEYAFSVEGAAAWLAIMVALSTIASLRPARAATRLTVHQALAYE